MAGAGGTPTTCEPNATEKCGSCSALGSRRCAPDGSGWSSCECADYGAEIAVSPNGNDGASGSLTAPFKTLKRAQQEVQKRVAAGLKSGGLAVWLREGIYSVSETLTLGPSDSGSSDKPVVWRGYPGEKVRLVGGVTIAPGAFKPVSASSPIHSRLDPSAQNQVVTISLPSIGVKDYGALSRRGFCHRASAGPLEVFANGKPLTLARWPDATQHTVKSNLEQQQTVQVLGSPNPDVSGSYAKSGSNDGVARFTRQGLVGGLQYHLYRNTWTHQNKIYTAWFVATQTSGYPKDTNPWWFRYDQSLGEMKPSAGGSGKLRFQSPEVVNHGFAEIAGASSNTVWQYAGDRPKRWAQPDEVWFHGFWKFAWADCHVKTASINTATRTVTLAEQPSYGATEGQPYYAYNMPEEITVPGEYWVDRNTGSLYLWPPAGFSSAQVVVSLLEAPLIRLKDASFVVIQDLILEASRSDLVSVEDGSNNQLLGLTLRNGGAGAGRLGGSSQQVRSCNVHDNGNGGFEVTGGDRPSLAKGKNTVENSHFHRLSRWEWTYRPAVQLHGVGNAARGNTMHTLPHSAVIFWGNEHQIEENHIHHVCRFSSDAGAIYTGRDWGARGNIVRHNLIHDLSTWFEGFGVQGIYLDDCVSGIRVEGNVLYKISDHGIQHGGGRDDIMVNNIIAKSAGGLTADSRCFDQSNVPNNTPGDSWNLLEKLNKVGYQKEPWASRWPKCAAIPNDWAALSSPPSHWLKPEGSEFATNLGFSNGIWINASPETLAAYAKKTNNVADADPLFVDETDLRKGLKPTSPAYSIPGFQKIPFAKIGVKP